VKIRGLISQFEAWAPLSLSESWDASGLQVGNPTRDIESVLLCLDVTAKVLEEAEALEVEMIVSHHPFLFHPLTSLQTHKGKGKIIQRLLQRDICVYSMHTNLDKAQGGMNDYAASLLGLSDISVMIPSPPSGSLFKLVTFVPETHKEAVLSALFNAGGGKIGTYEKCAFLAKGVGTFQPGKKSTPFIGKKGGLNHVDERRIEVLFSETTLKKGLRALKEAHPYEVPAYDIYPLYIADTHTGFGRVGRLSPPCSWPVFIKNVYRAFATKTANITGIPDSPVKTVAICTGSGASFIPQAARVADVYVTGDVKFHDAQTAQSLGLPVIDCGHFATEKIFSNLLETWLVEKGLDRELKIFKSTAEENPLTPILKGEDD